MLFARRCGFGLGRGKRILHSLWMHSRGERSADVEYNGLKLRLYPGDSTLDAQILTSSRLREKQELAFLKPVFASGGAFLAAGPIRDVIR